MVNREPYNGLLQSLYTWVVFSSPIYRKTYQGTFFSLLMLSSKCSAPRTSELPGLKSSGGHRSGRGGGLSHGDQGVEKTVGFSDGKTTPWKIHIEPENDGFEDDFPFPGVYSQVPC